MQRATGEVSKQLIRSLPERGSGSTDKGIKTESESSVFSWPPISPMLRNTGTAGVPDTTKQNKREQHGYRHSKVVQRR